jgi:hypothetical protein
MQKYMSRTIRISLIVIATLILMRAALPYVLLSYLQHRLASVPNYQITLKDLSLRLYREEIIFSDLSVHPLKPSTASTMLIVKNFSLKISWQSLLHKTLIVKTSIDHPVLTIFLPPKEASSETPPPDLIKEWKTIITAIFPLPFKNVFVSNGELHFVQLNSQPSSDWVIKNIELHLSNDQALASRAAPLPSVVIARANTMDGAPIHLNIYFNPLSALPTFKINAAVTGMQLKPLNPLLHYYTKVEVNAGTFDFFLEAAAKEGKVMGYVKPLVKNLKIKSPNKEAPLSEKIYTQVAKIATAILKNSQTKRVAAKIKIQGNINQPGTHLWPIIASLLKNAFIQALLPQLDHSINLQSIEAEK